MLVMSKYLYDSKIFLKFLSFNFKRTQILFALFCLYFKFNQNIWDLFDPQDFANKTTKWLHYFIHNIPQIFRGQRFFFNKESSLLITLLHSGEEIFLNFSITEIFSLVNEITIFGNITKNIESTWRLLKLFIYK